MVGEKNQDREMVAWMVQNSNLMQHLAKVFFVVKLEVSGFCSRTAILFQICIVFSASI
jgi:hypothetical protein